MKIWFLRRETDYGPFFSSRENAIAFLDSENDDDLDLESTLNGTDPYINLVEVELDTEVYFDG